LAIEEVTCAAPHLFNRIFERHALRIILAEPSLSRLLGGEDLEVIDVADFLRGVDVDPDGLVLR
jgi:hypothetical protein